MNNTPHPILDYYFAFPSGGKHVRDMNREELIEALTYAIGESKMWLSMAEENLEFAR